MTDSSASALPAAKTNQVYVQISALNGGFVTLPEYLFITGADPKITNLVPSMCFLIQHSGHDGKSTKMVFDLGIKRDLNQYAQGMQAHISKRQPIHTQPDCKASLEAGGLNAASDIDYVIPSHTHWDHIGTPGDYPNSKFIVGSGTFHIFKNGAPHYPADMFEKEPLPPSHSYELPPTPDSKSKDIAGSQQTDHKWTPLGPFPNTIDFFGDGSVYLIDAPGHLQGHTNLLACIGESKWVYLGGDCCHDYRILSGEKDIAMYDDGHGGQRSVHSDLPTAKQTLQTILKAMKANGDSIEWIIAHDAVWSKKNQHRFWPNKL